MRRESLIAAIALVCVLGLAAGGGVGPAAGPAAERAHAAEDTGTYRILSYIVTIVPQPDGSWIADYAQEWEVTGGHIPWVTVGLPDYNYTILTHEGAAVQVSRADYGSWSGVRVDLDRDYASGETFRFSFRIRQDGMGHRKGDAVEFAFSPGWYDRAETENLEVRLKNPGKSEDLLYASPEPAERTDGQVVWAVRLGRGERLKVAFALSAELFPHLGTGDGRPPGAARGEFAADEGPPVAAAISVLLVVACVIAIIIILAVASSRGGYRGRRGIYYGTYFPVPPARRSTRGPGTSSPRGGSGSSGGSRRSGGGGGFGGRSIGCACVSCACACVSCACACACAGGGGAGCARKFDGARAARAAVSSADTAAEACLPAPGGDAETLPTSGETRGGRTRVSEAGGLPHGLDSGDARPACGGAVPECSAANSTAAGKRGCLAIPRMVRPNAETEVEAETKTEMETEEETGTHGP
ncbi:MAG: hypothetical protein ACM3ZU_08735 [Bacteroidota bacterium]